MGEFRPSKPGERRGGRKAGVPNKLTTDLKVEYLKWLALNNSAAFASLLGKVLPLTLVGESTRPLVIETSDVSAYELISSRLARLSERLRDRG
jgi:hypothetical protein